MLAEPTKAQAGTFRALMSWALFMIEKSEWERVQAKLELKMDWHPTKKEIEKECFSIIPLPYILGACIQKVLMYFYYCDLRANMQQLSSSNTSSMESTLRPATKLYLKPLTSDIQQIIQNQLSHVDKGCLSDPPAYVVQLQRQNPRTGKVYTGCSMGSCKVDNRMLNHLLDSSHVAPSLAGKIRWLSLLFHCHNTQSLTPF